MAQGYGKTGVVKSRICVTLLGMFALTLIKTASPPLTAAHIALAQGVLDQHNIRTDNRPPMWMEGHQAVRGWLLDKPTPEQMHHIREALTSHGVDAICEADGMPKLKLACFDLESTVIEQESLDLLARRVGQGEIVEKITARAMNGEITMHDAFVERVGLLKGTTQEDIEAVRASLTPFPMMQQTIKWLQSQNVRCVVISSGVDIFVRPMAELFGFDAYHCSHLNITDGTMDGTLRGDIVTKQGKADITATLIRDMEIDPMQALAMGDGANDAIMMEVVGRAFAWRPKPALAAAVPNQLWHSDYRALRYALV